ncbi:c-type cytochrome [Verminephrobacter aporrectodeae]|uniref:c-type cytochrome n=1 Tax=Verminephrobacter aporrectodeae TaxID=1110389 RepID=UPI002237B21C|nr:cytochrome c4 [Verminephrobacter aporrectodeae]MCW5258163.1 cytochrome c4 [Verminephrobacter aporrectodeae subsp. tuberculatae]MCW8163644.1 cytochrome c4 [Verminephrobacter aporrectodeae subsp. tuberculatae]MCW8171151.1 cytochrome c4 [Verminephrobacter aporrectodeae subsp. tuberculatae]MCW8177434.1 cytochrome c4 [Verminephrobacter aporrectodeae subsp. tuberculatae]MCW8198079.1 cytochrome c4 [Verminephrobacter aporrectodeae subsp. tuberculatae]
MNQTLTTLFALAVACATASSHAQEVKGDVQAGKQKIAMCIGCHGIAGYQASFPEVHKVPMISGQSGKYIAAALLAYQKGERKHPTMRSIAESLSEQDIADLAAYYEQHGKSAAERPTASAREPGARVAELMQKGDCVSCHGAQFSKPTDPAFPKVAGQHADYLLVALKSYKAEKNARIGRSNAAMAVAVKQLSNAELKALANYMSGLEGELRTVPQPLFR